MKSPTSSHCIPLLQLLSFNLFFSFSFLQTPISRKWQFYHSLPPRKKYRRRSPKSSPLLPRNQNNQFRFDESGEVRFNGATHHSAVFNLSTIMGAGIMGLPAAVKELGLLPGLIMIVVMGVLTESSIEIILRFGKAAKSVSYSGVVGDSFGRSGRTLLQICLIVNNLGLLIGYMIIIVHPIENELKDPSDMKFNVQVSLTTCASVYVLATLFGLLLFGEQTLDDVLANFDADLGLPDKDTVLNDFMRLCYVIHLILAFPVVFFSLRLGVDGLLFPTSVPIEFDNPRFLSINVGLLGIIFIAAMFIPNIWTALQFTGATAATSLGFIFPAAIVRKDRYGIATKKDRMLSWFFIILAVSTCIIGAISSNIYSIFKHQGWEILRAEE